MKISDIFEETYFALIANKARSGLTILGIVIGIGSVIAMVAIGQGTQASIESNIQSLGSNLIMITPGASRGVGSQVSQGQGSAQNLTKEDADAIKKEISLAKEVAPELSSRYQVTAKGKNTNTQAVGVTPVYATVRNIEIESGNFISEQNIKSLSKVAVIGPTTKEDLFGTTANVIGQTIRIKKMDFKIIGVTKAKGGSGFSNQDDRVIIPLTTAQQFLAGSDRLSTIYIQSQDNVVMTELKQLITNLLLLRHNISNPLYPDFSILSQEDIIATASSITGTFTILLAAIAGISLLVGGIGIMNMMLTNVTERTREIGLRKAIGAKRNNISNQFLAESIMLTLIGGLFGILLGWGISLAIAKFGGIATSISSSSIMLAFGVSAAIGIIFGYYPARRASKLSPIEALRFE